MSFSGEKLINIDCSNITYVNTEFLEVNDSSFEDDIDNDLFESETKEIYLEKDSITKKKKKPKKCKHFKWSTREDNKLRQLVIIFGNNNWRELAKKMDGRNSRQCRERWQYYLNPYINRGIWTKEEDKLILQKRDELGPKWMDIQKFFPFRTDAMIKNRYRALIKMKNQKEKDLQYLNNLYQYLNNQKRIITHNSKLYNQSQNPKKSINKLEDSCMAEQINVLNYFSQNENIDNDGFFENDDLVFDMNI